MIKHKNIEDELWGIKELNDVRLTEADEAKIRSAQKIVRPATHLDLDPNDSVRFNVWKIGTAHYFIPKKQTVREWFKYRKAMNLPI